MGSASHILWLHAANLYRWVIYITYVVYSCLYFVCEVIAGVLEIPTDAPHYDALLHQARQANSYEEWLPIASMLDDMDGFQKWRTEEASTSFSFEGVMRVIEELLELRSAGSVDALLDGLQKHVHRSLYGISHRRLYLYRTGTKTVIHSYTSLVCFLLSRVGEAARADRQLALRTREVLSEMHHVYGSTALFLQGGVLASSAHLGVAKALYEAGLLPRILYGSGSGALVATLVACRTDLSALFNTDDEHNIVVEIHGLITSLSRGISRWKRCGRLKQVGKVCDPKALAVYLQRAIGDITFEEAYARTGRVLNIPYTATPPLQMRCPLGVEEQLLNYLTAPNVLIRSAVFCAMSSATFSISLSGAGSLPISRTLLVRTRLMGSIVVYDPPVVSQSYATSCGDHPGYGVLDPTQRIRALFSVRFCFVSDASLHGYLWRLLHRSARGNRLRKHYGMWDLLHYTFALVLFSIANVALLAFAFLGYETITAPSPASMNTFFEDDEGENMRLYPISNLWSYLRLWHNPTHSNMQVLVKDAERQVWPRLEQLRMSISVEQVLSATMKRLQARK